MFFLLQLLFLCQFLLHLRSLPDLFSCVPIGCKKRFGELRKLVVDCDILQTASVGCQPLIERNGIAFGVFPIRNWWWNLPSFLIFSRKLSGRRMHDGWWWTGRPSWDLLVLKLWRLHRILLSFHYFYDPIVLLARVSHLISRCISHVRRFRPLPTLDILWF